MKTLRWVHLYLGCAFAPLLIFFALSGIWQTLDIHGPKGGTLEWWVKRLSTLHTGDEFKNGFTLSSTCMKGIIVAMAIGLVFSIVLGVVIAFKSGRKKAALISLLAGILIPAAVIAVALWS